MNGRQPCTCNVKRNREREKERKNETRIILYKQVNLQPLHYCMVYTCFMTMSVSQTVQSRMVKWLIMNSQSETAWKWSWPTRKNILEFSWRDWENHETHQDMQCPCTDSNRTPPEEAYNSTALLLGLWSCTFVSSTVIYIFMKDILLFLKRLIK